MTIKIEDFHSKYEIIDNETVHKGDLIIVRSSLNNYEINVIKLTSTLGISNVNNQINIDQTYSKWVKVIPITSETKIKRIIETMRL